MHLVSMSLLGQGRGENSDILFEIVPLVAYRSLVEDVTYTLGRMEAC